MPERKVVWQRCQGDEWCRLFGLDLGAVDPGHLGVYVIWSPATDISPASAVYVGQGNIRRRLEFHRTDTRFRQSGPLLVTWTLLSLQDELNGIELYVAQQLRPSIGKTWPAATPVPVNLP